MSGTRVTLSVLDLVPVSSGSTAREALQNSIDLAQRTEALGYARYWLAEHHLNPGNAGSTPLAFCAILAAATRTIRVGTAATLVGQWAPLQIAEGAGLVATLFDGRMDLGLGRAIGVRPSGESPSQASSAQASSAQASSAHASSAQASSAQAESPAPPGPPASPAPPAPRVVDGLLLPTPVSADPLRGRFGLLADLVRRPPGESFEHAVTSILQQLDGTFVDATGEPVAVLPAEGSGAAVWIHGSSGGESARLAGRLGLPFGANYHSTPTTVLDAVAAYRDAFVPGRIPTPHVIVSTDVLVAESPADAARIGRGFDRWVLSVRAGAGTLEYPSPDESIAAPLTADETERVQDRVSTRFVGSPDQVVAHLEILQHATGADELLVTTSTHAHADRVRSYELLAHAWRLDT
jgi:alkanesulfonate monooxygenase SsuD/methylene tetrahydromethanopterin reductase-like flavin-dependent oxidoreductase (luciferase family)